MSNGAPLPAPREATRQLQRRTETLRRRAAALEGKLSVVQQQLAAHATEAQELRAQLAITRDVTNALELLSKEMLDDLTAQLRESLSLALCEVLQQPLAVTTEVEHKNNSLRLTFGIQRDGKEEHMMRGQGGSVTNVLSVALRFFALRTLDPARHRPFIVLDEQDCWLRPDLVPRLASIVRQASSALHLQVLVISHHHREAFAAAADLTHELQPHPEGVRVKTEQ